MSVETVRPLAGLKVLEFGQIVTVPFCGMLLADLGADVVKVENADGGDGMRQWPPLMRTEPGAEAYSGNFASLNRNKRSVAANLKEAADVARVQALCAVADIVIENFRPGVMQRLGLGYETLRERRPELVYCSVTGYGQEGPYAKKGAFDVTVQAISGLMSVTGEADGAPVKCGVPVSDFTAGLYAAYSILAAVMEVRRTGVGARIDCSMLGCTLGISALQISEYFGTGNAPQRLGSAHPRNAPYQAFQASDRPFVIAAGNDKLWGEVCEAVSLMALKDDARFTTQTLRAAHQRELAALLQPCFARRSAAEWLTEFDRRGVPCAPINDFADILADPHVKESGWVSELTLPNGMTTPAIGFPVQISGYEFRVDAQPPRLGEHNAAVRSEWLK
ncbi:MAG: CoA transferase [Methylibium sp.]|uniref:CaiB/BaiF CoA transferase family protein n=1 Tax=Methylibium sp. TaxID=2067992 RepID=UPI0017D03DCA|nr:CoA transferase [Methylibium sp.]MBA3599071.1 CoA transferase [Methylibium sp.]